MMGNAFVKGIFWSTVLNIGMIASMDDHGGYPTNSRTYHSTETTTTNGSHALPVPPSGGSYIFVGVPSVMHHSQAHPDTHGHQSTIYRGNSAHPHAYSPQTQHGPATMSVYDPSTYIGRHATQGQPHSSSSIPPTEHIVPVSLMHVAAQRAGHAAHRTGDVSTFSAAQLDQQRATTPYHLYSRSSTTLQHDSQGQPSITIIRPSAMASVPIQSHSYSQHPSLVAHSRDQVPQFSATYLDRSRTTISNQTRRAGPSTVRTFARSNSSNQTNFQNALLQAQGVASLDNRMRRRYSQKQLHSSRVPNPILNPTSDSVSTSALNSISLKSDNAHNGQSQVPPDQASAPGKQYVDLDLTLAPPSHATDPTFGYLDQKRPRYEIEQASEKRPTTRGGTYHDFMGVENNLNEQTDESPSPKELKSNATDGLQSDSAQSSHPRNSENNH